MFEKWRIKAHMEVTDSAGRHVGTVDSVNDGRIKLTRTDSNDGSHHYLDLDHVDQIDGDRVMLKAGAPLPAMGTPPATDPTLAKAPASHSQEFVSDGPSPTQGPQGADGAPFGTSGKGTGMGGSGTS